MTVLSLNWDYTMNEWMNDLLDDKEHPTGHAGPKAEH